MTKKCFFILILFHTISVSLFSQKVENRIEDDEKCVINEVNVDINEGTINVGIQNIQVQICKPCNYFFNSTEVLSRFDLKENSSGVTKVKEVFSKVIGKEKEVAAKQFFDSIQSTKSYDCNLSLIQEAIEKKTPYEVYQNESRTATIIRYSNQEYELAKYGLKINYLQKEGLTRIKELGRYYFIQNNDTPLLEIDGEAERYDFATDFNNSISIIGNLTSSMNYRLMDTKGNKSKFSFIEFHEAFGGFKGVYKVKSKTGQFFLVNSKLQIISGFYDSISYFKDKDYTKYNSYGRYTNIHVEGNTYYRIVNETSLNGLLKTDSLGNIVDSLQAKYHSIEFLGHNIISAGNITKYELMDAENKFTNLYNSENKIYYCRSNDSGFEFSISDPKSDSIYDFKRNTHGVFIDFTRTIIKPEYYSLGYFNRLGLIIVVRSPDNNYNSKKGKWTQTFLDLNGKQVFNDYGYLQSPDWKNYIKAQTLKEKWGYLNEKEKFVIKPVYDYILDFDQGYAWAELENKKCGLIDRDGKFEDFSEMVSRLHHWNGKNWIYYPYKFTDYGISITEFAIGSSNYSERKFGLINYSKEILLKNHPNKLYILESGIKDVGLVTDSFQLFLYFKKGKPFLKTIAKIVKPFENGFAIAECVEGGLALIDSSGNQYRNCLPYDSLNIIQNGKFVIATKDKLKGIVKTSTGEKFIELLLDNIELNKDTFICTKGNKSFVIDSNINNKKIKFYSGDFSLFETIVLKKVVQ